MIEQEPHRKLIEQGMRGAVIKPRVDDIKDGEKSSAYFLGKEKNRASMQEIKFLEINGNKINHQNAILEYFIFLWSVI